MYAPDRLSTTPSLRYRADIDGLRAVAVLLVLVFHFSLVSGSKAGFLGVDVFFVISGFLMASIIKGQLDVGTFSLRTFYINRIRRLAPALLVVLLGSVGFGAFWLFPFEFLELSKQAVFSQIYLSNVYYWRSVNYFGLDAANVYLLHTWSLAIEEQFYLFFPIGLILLHRYARTLFWPAITVGLAASFALNLAFVNTRPEATFYLLPTRAWELLIGALVARIAPLLTDRRGLGEALGFAGAGLIVAAVLLHRRTLPFPGTFALLPTLGAACLLLAGAHRPAAVSRSLSWAPLVYVGRISYSLYLVHWPINIFARSLLPTYGVRVRLAMFGLSFALAAALYHAVENPIRRRVVMPANRRLLIGYGAGVVATIAVFLGLQATDGLPQRFWSNAARIAAYAGDKTAPLEQCKFRNGNLLSKMEANCRIGASEKTPRWLIYGDSHAWAVHAAFDQWLRLKGEAGVFVYAHSCLPVQGVHMVGDHPDRCYAFNEAVLEFLEAQPNLQNVVLVSAWRQVRGSLISTGPDTTLSPADAVQLFLTAFSRTVERLHAMKRAVHVWEPVPGARGKVPIALARGGPDEEARLRWSFAEYQAGFRFFFEALARSRQFIDSTFSSASLLCSSGSCAVTHAGIPLYFDHDHATKSSADFWVSVLNAPVVQAPSL